MRPEDYILPRDTAGFIEQEIKRIDEIEAQMRLDGELVAMLQSPPWQRFLGWVEGHAREAAKKLLSVSLTDVATLADLRAIINRYHEIVEFGRTKITGVETKKTNIEQIRDKLARMQEEQTMRDLNRIPQRVK